MNHNWRSAPPQSLLVERLAQDLACSELLAQCLANRGLSEPAACRAFLQPRLRDLADPFLLPHMDVAVARLFLARAQGEPVVIFGDYDVDGVTATALLLEVLGALGWQVDAYLPHRLEEGYGLSQEGVTQCLAQHPARLLLAVDCGSTATDTVRGLGQQGVDVIVLDHHQVSSPPPDALAIVNPQLGPPGTDGFRQLCSVGLAFKLAHALLKRGREQGCAAAQRYDLRPLLELVALGTVADLVPLTGENRILVTAGLDRLSVTQRPGLAAIRDIAGIAGRVGTYEVGYQLAPRLNAAGRLESAADALRLLRSPDAATALPIARNLDAWNRERQRIENGMTDQVIGAVKARFNPATDYVIVEGQLLWHIGVVGIVASRVLREFYRPTIIVGGDGTHWRGSGRSIEGFDLAAALRECDDLLLRHGGHAMAAGLTVAADNLPALRARLNEVARLRLRPEQLQPSLRLDAAVPLGDMTVARVEELSRLEPLGQGNPVVQLIATRVRCLGGVQRMGKEQKHARLKVSDGRTTHGVVWWNCGEARLPSGDFDLAFQPQINDYNGRRSVQLKLLDVRPA